MVLLLWAPAQHLASNMNDSVLIPIIVALLPPIIAGIVGLISSRSGIPGKIKEIDYYLKRFELITQLSDYLDKQEISGGNEHYRRSINGEISEILAFIQKSEVEETKVKVLIEEQKSSRFIRLFILPKPITAGGWAATVIYYLYAFSTFMYSIYLIFPSENISPNLNDVLLPGIISGAILTLLGRYFALRSWQKKRKQIKEKINNA